MSEPTSGRKWYQRTTFILSASLVVIAVVALVVVGAAKLGGRPDPAPAAVPTPGASAPVTPAGGACSTDKATSPPAAPPMDVRWEALGPVLLPYGGSKYGPCRVTSTTASGYAHTPMGALIASVQILARSGNTDPVAVAVDTIQNQFVASTDRDALLASAKAAAGTRLSPDRAGRVAAYSITSYSPDTATIQLALQSSALPGQYVTLPLILRWIDGDWRMIPPVTGDFAGTGHVVTQLTGFTAWGAR
jgi:hypothetical protein